MKNNKQKPTKQNNKSFDPPLKNKKNSHDTLELSFILYITNC